MHRTHDLTTTSLSAHCSQPDCVWSLKTCEFVHYTRTPNGNIRLYERCFINYGQNKIEKEGPILKKSANNSHTHRRKGSVGLKMSLKYSQYAPISPSQSLPNLISSLSDVEKGRSGLPQPSNTRGLRENEDTNALAKTLSVCSATPSNGEFQVQNNVHMSKSQTPPTHPNMLSSLYAPDNEKEGRNSYQLFQQHAEKDFTHSLFGATIVVGDKEMKGEFSHPKQNPLSDLDMPSHIQEFKQQFMKSEENRIKLPLLTQLSPRTRKRISLLPKATDQEEEKVAEYSQIGKTKVKRKDTSCTTTLDKSMDYHAITNNAAPTRSKMDTNAPIFKQLGKVILKNKNIQYRKNKDLIGRHPAPVMLSDQVKSLGKLNTNKLDGGDGDNTDHVGHLTAAATEVSCLS
jgi:hypothetical protein